MFNSIVKKSFAALAIAVMATGVANAAIDAGITTAITSAGTDAATVGAAVLVVLVGIAAFKWIRKAV